MTTTCPPGETSTAADWPAIGTQVRLVVTDPAQLETGRRLLVDDLAALDAACSRFRADSELAMVERAGGAPVHVGPVLADAIDAALHAARLTDGDVDPTLATDMAALGYDRDFDLVTRDGPPVRLTVRTRPRWREVRFDRDTGMLSIPAGMRLDLGATAKARAADLAAARLADRLGCGVLVSLGGDIAIGGDLPDGGWRIRIQDVTGHPDDPPAGPAAVIALTTGGLATSGITARRWRRGGITLHHILDPRTGLPVTPVWRTVSVAAGSAFYANIASTAAMIRGRAARGWLADLGLPARLVGIDGEVHPVAGWPAEIPA